MFNIVIKPFISLFLTITSIIIKKRKRLGLWPNRPFIITLLIRSKAMNIFHKIWMWFKQIKMLPANLAKIASVDEYLKLQQEYTKMKDRAEKAEKCLAKEDAIKAGRMLFCNNVYWSQYTDGEIEYSPYCPRCFELDGKAIHLITWNRRADGNGMAKCPECKIDEIPFREPE
jgi:hypothetical protein